MILVWLALLNGLFLVPGLALPGANPLISLEVLVIWALLCGLHNQNLRYRVTLALAVTYGLLAFLVLADTLIRESLGRGLNLYLEVRLLDATWNLLDTNVGGAPAAIALTVLLVLLLALGWLFRFGLERLRHHSPGHLGKPLWLISGLALAGAVTPWIGSPALAFVANQASLIKETHRTTQAFAAELAATPGRLDQPKRLTTLADTDVVFGFIESYGISTLTDVRYQPVISQSLTSMAKQLTDAGLTVATGRLRSPIQGGQSWLGHLSVLSGQWIKNQLAYETFLSSGYSTLIDDFRSTGHTTVAVMPAITRAWPEGRLFRYDRVYDHDDLGYQGPPFNWVTMPDQYTWRRFQELREQESQPLFAELALISSHAPWVPILPILDDWEAIGDGRVFRQWEGTGEAPVSLWRDPDRVREHFAKAISYALETAGGFAAHYVQEDTLLILLGDHQPAPLITGEDASRDVIVHVISADPALVEPFLSGDLPGFRRGVIPDLQEEGALMSRFRPFLHRQFSQPLLSGTVSRDLEDN
ncbi:alkaline phosphatase family protein [Marinobacter confluentis]|uniref:Sulfatase n=1 Tax=Marinobacter confluentis TaxID=1697557 RepID=A0A4Z1C2V8_9GAMM|nr:sulfatase [Marinobacter confluentis]TGN39442.1 sulfatase [Marinobacter confluentis]